MARDYTITVSGHFDAAHRLPGYQGKCANLHGHTWRVTAIIVLSFIEDDELNQGDGMTVDFRDIEECWLVYDHTYLNDVFDNPTAEVIARAIVDSVCEIVEEQMGTDRAFVEVNLCESLDASITVTRDHKGLYQVQHQGAEGTCPENNWGAD